MNTKETDPDGEEARLRETFDEIPRYLFRVFTPNSRGTTDRIWTKSMDASSRAGSSLVDIFARRNKDQVAGMIDRHLRWQEGSEDNLVSWTSSLLFAVVYMFHLYANSRDRSAFEDISLCIIDTKQFPQGVFLRDMDLIQTYHPINVGLQRMRTLRSSRYYFGEYLSQGALKIEHKCGIVSAQDMMTEGLCHLRHEFTAFRQWNPSQKVPWAAPTVALRDDLHLISSSEVNKKNSAIAVDIAKLFGCRSRMPVAANLVALLPHRIEDVAIMHLFSSTLFTGNPPFQKVNPS